MWSNFHTHSLYCDGKGSPGDFVAKAGESMVSCLGFSSHAPLPFDCTWCMKSERLAAYLYELEQLKQSQRDVAVYKSLEIDFIPGVISANEFKSQLDYTLGSIHFVDAFPDGRHWEIDGPHASFLQGLDAIFNNDIRSVIARYFELTREMIATACPTIVGHLDKIKIQNIGEKFFKESDSWYQKEVTRTLALVRDAGAIVEVNTRGLYQKKSLTPYPSPWVLDLLLQYNIPVTLSSDAHHPDDLVNCFSETASLLKK